MLVLCGLLWAVIAARWLVAGGLALLLGRDPADRRCPLSSCVAVALFVLLAAASGRAARRAGASTPPGPRPSWPVGVSGAVPGRSSPGRSRARARAYTDTMAAWRAGGEITPFKPWLWMSQWVFRDFDGAAGSYGPVALAALVTAIVVLTCGPWATRLGRSCAPGAWPTRHTSRVVLDPFTQHLPLRPAAVPAASPSSSAVAGPDRRVARWLWPRTALSWPRASAGRCVDLQAARLRSRRRTTRRDRDRPAAVAAQGRSALAGRALRRPVALPARRVCRRRGSSRSSPWSVAATWFQTAAGVGHLEPTVGDIFGLWDGNWYAGSPRTATPCHYPSDPDTGAADLQRVGLLPRRSRCWCGR